MRNPIGNPVLVAFIDAQSAGLELHVQTPFHELQQPSYTLLAIIASLLTKLHQFSLDLTLKSAHQTAPLPNTPSMNKLKPAVSDFEKKLAN